MPTHAKQRVADGLLKKGSLLFLLLAISCSEGASDVGSPDSGDTRASGGGRADEPSAQTDGGGGSSGGTTSSTGGDQSIGGGTATGGDGSQAFLCNDEVCCDAVCGECGGEGCAQRPGGGAACCTGAILGSTDYCEGDPERYAPCIRGSEPILPRPAKGALVVDTDAGVGEITPFWETRAMINQNRFLSSGFRKGLETIKPFTENFNLVRMLGGRVDRLNDYYKGVDAKGNVIADFSELIKSMDAFMLTGFEPRIVLDNVPWKMTQDAVEHVYGNTAPPDDYDLWRQYVSLFVQALIDEYGKEQVSGWRFRVGTEPNYYPHHWSGTRQQFLKHYDITVDTVMKLLPDVEIGPGNIILNQADSNWGLDIIRHAASGTNFATGKTGTRLSFFCVSYYEFLRQETVALERVIKPVRETLDRYPQFRDTALDIQEFGILRDENGNSLNGLNDITEFGASWYASVADVAYRYGLDEIYDWGFHVGDLPELPHARFHVVDMLRKMGSGVRVDVQRGSLADFSGVIASKNGKRLYLLLYNHEPKRSAQTNEVLNPIIIGRGVEQSKEWALSEWTVDEKHSVWAHEAYQDCEDAGATRPPAGSMNGSRISARCPAWDTVRDANLEKYGSLGALAQTRKDVALKSVGGQISLEVPMTSHSVKLIELVAK